MRNILTREKKEWHVGKRVSIGREKYLLGYLLEGLRLCLDSKTMIDKVQKLLIWD